jgi:hypothetical protein
LRVGPWEVLFSDQRDTFLKVATVWLPSPAQICMRMKGMESIVIAEDAELA